MPSRTLWGISTRRRPTHLITLRLPRCRSTKGIRRAISLICSRRQSIRIVGSGRHLVVRCFRKRLHGGRVVWCKCEWFMSICRPEVTHVLVLRTESAKICRRCCRHAALCNVLSVKISVLRQYPFIVLVIEPSYPVHVHQLAVVLWLKYIGGHCVSRGILW